MNGLSPGFQYLIFITIGIEFFSLFQLCLSENPPEVTRLEKQWVYDDRIVAIGHSSGASFAHHLHLIHSKLFIGVGIFAGYYYKGKSHPNAENESEEEEEESLRGTPFIDLAEVKGDLERYEKTKLVDSFKYLKKQRVYIEAGAREITRLVIRVANIVEIYAPYVNSPSNIHVKVLDTGHGFPKGYCTPKELEADDPYLGGCHYNGVLRSLEFIHGEKLARYDKTMELMKLRAFDQKEFYADIDGQAGLEDHGYLYVPHKCGRRYKCLLLIYFHGCHGSPTPTNGTDSGFQAVIKVAEANNIIVILPVLRSISGNSNRCWDFFGYGGDLFATNKGPQVMAIRRMIQRVAEV